MRTSVWSGSAAALSLGLTLGFATPAAAEGAGAGEKVFNSAAPPCGSCHAVKAGVKAVGPSMAGLAARAQQRVKAPGYKGKAKDAQGYIRESIVAPDAYLVPGQGYAAGGKSLMPATYTTLSPAQLDQLVTYLMSLK